MGSFIELGEQKRANRSEKRTDWLVQIRHRVISGPWGTLETSDGSLETAEGWTASGDHLFLALSRGRNCLPQISCLAHIQLFYLFLTLI